MPLFITWPLQAFSILLFMSATAFGEPVTAPNRSETLTIESKILGEEREIYVLAPEGYEPGGDGYTTLYVLDGEWSFPLVSSYIDYLSRWNRIPKLVVTGIRNVDRNRDYIFAEDPSFPGTGGAEDFLRFLKEEWSPLIERKHNGNGQRILYGHSFGGSFALYALMTDPEFFDAYIAIGASTWVAQRGLFDLADDFLQKSLEKNTFLYTAVAEADGGATVPDGIAFAELFESRPLENLEWYFEIIDETNHFTAVMPALAAAVENLYPVWGMSEEVENILRGELDDSIEQWFARKSRDLGFRFVPPKMELEFLAINLAQEGLGEQAEGLMHELLKRQPDSFTSTFALGIVYSRQQKYDAAIPLFERAARLAEAAGETPTLIARYDRAADIARQRLAAME